MKTLFTIFKKKESGSASEEEKFRASQEKKSSFSLKALFSKKIRSDKLKALPEIAQQVFLDSGLTEEEVLVDPETFEILITCLYYTTPKHTFQHISVKEWTSNDSDVASPSNLSPKSPKTKHACSFEASSINQKEGKQEQTLTPKHDSFRQLTKSLSKSISSSESLRKIDLKKIKKAKKPKWKKEDLVQDQNPREIYSKALEIGRGSYATVYIAYDKQAKRRVALKYLQQRDWNDPEDQRKILNEVGIMKESSHPNIVNLVGAYHHCNKIWIAMEYCDGGTLKELLTIDLSESQMAFVLRQVLEALSYLHSQHRIHRDLKSHNILLNMNGDVKVADLGLAIQGVGEQKGMAGSKFWMAPEMIRREKYTNKVDIWSLGAVAFEMAQTVPPYYDYRPLRALFYTATRGAQPLKKPQKYSEEYRGFLDQCFQMNPKQRPTADQLLKDKFLTKACDKKSLNQALKVVFLMKATSGI